ncbi:3-hydroxyacyl-CoA dehydrogenase [Deinococcus sp.]|uniref:3-hydroxyacyl-CoA dehydrogenase n=1 Tax=Deinococcus sp. TaxID=47478 RepID=UPI003B5C1FD5
MDIKNVTVCGTGVLGCQIAFQSAFHGFNVRLYNPKDESISKAQTVIQALPQTYQHDIAAAPQQTAAALGRITFSTDLGQAVRGADLVIEAVPELLDVKTAFYRALAQVADAQTIFATNTSALLPSQLMDATGRPERFLALHFANRIWLSNTAEIMGTPRTDPGVFDQIVAFAQAIGMVALPLHKEQAGYILNSLLIPLINAGLALVVGGVAEPQTVDKTWMVAMGAPRGPFASLDIIGLSTAYHITQAAAARGDAQQAAVAAYLKGYLDQGKLGVASGEGFYRYPDPAYLGDDFLK